MSTIREVAKRAGVSAMTVSRVLNNSASVRPKTRERVLEAILTLQYVPNPAARTLSSSRSRTIALVVADLTNPFFTQIAKGVEAVARQEGFGLILNNTDEDPDREGESLQVVRAARVDGVVWVPCGDQSTASARILIDNQLPTVLVDRLIPGAPYFDAVISDNRAGAKALANTLLHAGRAPLGAVFGRSETSVVRDRRLGFQDALAGYGIPWDDAFAMNSDAIHPDKSLLTTMRAAVPEISGVIAWNNVAAAEIFREASALNLRVPEDLVIATFEDPDPYHLVPEVFVVGQQNPFRMGAESARLLLERLRNPEDTASKTEILPITVEVGSHALAVPKTGLSL